MEIAPHGRCGAGAGSSAGPCAAAVFIYFFFFFFPKPKTYVFRSDTRDILFYAHTGVARCPVFFHDARWRAREQYCAEWQRLQRAKPSVFPQPWHMLGYPVNWVEKPTVGCYA